MHGILTAEDALVHVPPEFGAPACEQRPEVLRGERRNVRTIIDDLSHEHGDGPEVAGSEVRDAFDRLGEPDGTGIVSKLLVDGDHARDEPLEDCGVDRSLGWEIVEEHALADTRARADLARRRAVVAARREQLLRRVEEPGADLVPVVRARYRYLDRHAGCTDRYAPGSGLSRNLASVPLRARPMPRRGAAIGGLGTAGYQMRRGGSRRAAPPGLKPTASRWRCRRAPLRAPWNR